jgi:hypothetical protein
MAGETRGSSSNISSTTSASKDTHTALQTLGPEIHSPARRAANARVSALARWVNQMSVHPA